MAHKFRYPIAQYKDRSGVHEIEQKHLENMNVRIEARSNHLVEPGTLNRLFVRHGKKSIYFSTYQFSASEPTTVKRGESKTIHNEQRGELFNMISGLSTRVKSEVSGRIIERTLPAKTAPSKIKIVTYETAYGSENKTLTNNVVEFSTDTYAWQLEACRATTVGRRVQHDFFGQSGEIPTSRLLPQVAVEVVYEHAPDDDTLESMLLQSEVSPLLVLFAFPRVGRLMFHVTLAGKLLTIRPTLWIWCGELFHEDKPTAIRSKKEFEALWKELEKDLGASA